MRAAIWLLPLVLLTACGTSPAVQRETTWTDVGMVVAILLGLAALTAADRWRGGRR